MKNKHMKKIIPAVLVISLIVSCAATGRESGTFRGRWYHYYDRGVEYSESTVWDKAEKDLKKTISKRPDDQRMARTYGMHFIDYFPHRELGIVYLNRGEINEAVRELEISVNMEESAKAVFYLNRARKSKLLMQKTGPSAPKIVIHSPSDGFAVNSFSVTVKGKVSGQGYVSKITINDQPYKIYLTQKEIEFEQEIAVDEGTDRITIISEDLLGSLSVKTVPLKVDRDGPIINLFNIAPEPFNGKEGIRLTGEVSDATGLSSLLINGKSMPVSNTRSYPFDILTEKDTPAGKFIIEASDPLNNRTTAEIDLVRELTAFNKKDAPVLLALNGDGFFSLDELPPVISLRGGTDIPSVFIDKYYVEGNVFDNKGIEEIFVNGREIETKRGRKIFFSKVVGLNEGLNVINIDAFDSSGNKAQSDFAVQRNIPEALQIGNRMSVSILPFDPGENKVVLAELAYEQLIGTFVEQKRFSVIERAKLEQVLLEQKLTKENLTDPANSIKVGRIMSADSILATAIHETDTSIEFISRVINTETSEVMEVKDVYSEDKSFSAIKKLMEGLASKIAASFPVVDGIVIKKSGEYIYLDLGSSTNIKKNMGLIVYRKGEEITHPLTGRSLGWDTDQIGEGNIEEISEDFSKARLRDRPGSKKIKVMDMVITK